MNKPIINLFQIEYTPPYYGAEPYKVYAVDGAEDSNSHITGHFHCTGCGQGNHYRFNINDEWLRFRCPHCDVISAHFDCDDNYCMENEYENN